MTDLTRKAESLDRRTALAALAAGALPLFGATAACAQTIGGSTLRSSAFGSFAEAVARWSRVGGTLVVDADHVEPRPITMQCVAGLSYRLTSDGPRTIAYAGPHFHWLFCILPQGRNTFVVDGALTFDGRNNCSIPFFARFETIRGDARRDFSIDGLTARNARMRAGVSRVDGSRTNSYGATAMAFSGGFDRLHLRNVRALNVSRDAGAGRPGSQGSAGIAVSGEGIGGARHVTIEDFEVANIGSDDRPGTPARGDMDGVLVFQGPEVGGSAPVIQRGTIREAAGRAVKMFAPAGGGITRDLTIYRSVHGNSGGSNDIAHQHGDGLIENITFHYSGNAHSQPTKPIGMSSGSRRPPGFPFREGIVRNIVINDSTGQPKGAIFFPYYNVADSTPRRFSLINVRDSGSANVLFLPGGLGVQAPTEIILERIDVDLRAGLFASEDRGARLRITARELVNRNARPVPLQVAYNNRPLPSHFGASLISDATVRGVQR